MISSDDDVYRVSYQNGNVQYNLVPYTQEDINGRHITPSNKQVSKHTLLLSEHKEITTVLG